MERVKKEGQAEVLNNKEFIKREQLRQKKREERKAAREKKEQLKKDTVVLAKANIEARLKTYSHDPNAMNFRLKLKAAVGKLLL